MRTVEVVPSYVIGIMTALVMSLCISIPVLCSCSKNNRSVCLSVCVYVSNQNDFKNEFSNKMNRVAVGDCDDCTWKCKHRLRPKIKILVEMMNITLNHQMMITTQCTEVRDRIEKQHALQTPLWYGLG